MKKKITLKLFVVTAIFFVCFISVQLVFQSLFFQKFYISRKTKNIKINIEKFEKDYIASLKSNEQTLEVIRKFEDKNNAKIVILESNGLFNYITDYENQVKDSAKISIIKSIINEWTSNHEAFIDIQDKDKTITYIFDSKFYNIKNIVSVNPIVVNGIPAKVIFAVTSLQPVDEAVSVMREFYVYIYIAAVLLIFILSFIYSDMISKPLVRLNKTASKMAQMDFSQKCNDDREDEIGNLAHTLNFLSQNLQSALSSLKKSNERLKKDIEKEKELDKMRKEFVASVSHELKTPISIIEGYAEGIKDGIVQGDDMEYYLDVIIDESQKMGRLVSDMLELSRLESGKFKINIKLFALDKTIYEVVKRINGVRSQLNNEISEVNDDELNNEMNEVNGARSQNYNKEIKINIDISDNLIVFGDEIRIEEVITNFLTNALRHTKKVGNIFVRTILKKDKVWVEIENEGEHISEDDIVKIWDKFYKVDKARTRKVGGTGLGLAIVKNILELHNSQYGAKNTEKGVKFYFSLVLKGTADKYN